jgi:zinc transporter ZupT
MDWKNFTKKFVYGVMGSGFTLAGAVVMYFTLSGFTQQVALWGTSIAFACAMYLHMKEPDGE